MALCIRGIMSDIAIGVSAVSAISYFMDTDCPAHGRQNEPAKTVQDRFD
jgi:hypothetical protein